METLHFIDNNFPSNILLSVELEDDIFLPLKFTKVKDIYYKAKLLSLLNFQEEDISHIMELKTWHFFKEEVYISKLYLDSKYPKYGVSTTFDNSSNQFKTLKEAKKYLQEIVEDYYFLCYNSHNNFYFEIN